MHYVKCFDILGIETAQVPCVELQGVPNTATEGAVGLFGMNMLSADHEIYVCTGVSGSIYTWIPLKGEGGNTVTDAKVNDKGELVLTLSNGTTINAGVVAGKGCFVNGVATDINFTSDPQTQIDNCVERLDDFNLSNGAGRDSVVQSYTGEVDGAHYGNTSMGESGAIFGEANKNNANRALMAGKLNENNGANHIVGGVYNNTSPKATSGLTVGYCNYNNHENGIMGGFGNKNNAHSTMLGGCFNEITEQGGCSVGGGQRNKANAENTIFNGQDNVIDAVDGSAFGHGLICRGLQGKVVAGRYNESKSNTLLEVGNGSAAVLDENGEIVTPEVRKNALEVYEDGTIKTNGILYHHDISAISFNPSTGKIYHFALSIYTNSSTKFTFDTFRTYIGFDGRSATGYYRNTTSETLYSIHRIRAGNSENNLAVYCNGVNELNETVSYQITKTELLSMSDTVTKIL